MVEVANFRAKDASQVTALGAKLKNPMVVIRVRDVANDEIPSVFILSFMRTAATVWTAGYERLGAAGRAMSAGLAKP